MAMVKLNKIYTKTGDDGTTGLVRGPRRMKHDLRVEAFGTVDEANSYIGLARLSTGSMPKSTSFWPASRTISSTSARTSRRPAPTPGRAALAAHHRGPDRLARAADRHYNDGLEPLTSFVLPGGRRSRPRCMSPARWCGAPSAWRSS